MTDPRATAPQTEYLRYHPGLAAVPPGEEALISSMIAALHKNNELQFRRSRRRPGLQRGGRPHAIRDAHAKSCGILTGELVVDTDLPSELRHGMFAEPGRRYPVIARISTTSGAIRSDQVRGVRGLGLKVLGVTGPSGERADARFADSNQDFVFVTEPMFLFAGAADYASAGMRTARLLARVPDRGMIALNTALRAARRTLSHFGRELPAKARVFADPNHHVLGQTFYTAAPVRYGDLVAKLRVAPSSPNVVALSSATIGAEGFDALTDAVAAFFERDVTDHAEYVVAVQLCTTIDEMPIEDATVEWPQTSSPYQRVGVIRYPRQTPHSDARRDFGDDRLTFNSWRGIAEHRPLGSINRLKLRVYEASSEFRHSRNNAPYVEPTELSAVPD